MKRAAWWATVHSVNKEMDKTRDLAHTQLLPRRMYTFLNFHRNTVEVDF